jgi:nucleotide-binding universal stress UspA family protein
MIRHVLVAIDPSNTAQRALEEAIELARGLRAELTVATVTPRLPAVAYRTGVDVGSLERDLEGESEELLRAAVASVPDDVTVRHVRRHGAPAEELLKLLDEVHPDVIVLGSRRRGRFASNVLGSVAASIHFNSTVPLLSIPPVEDDA